jgi:hypothetical protein
MSRTWVGWPIGCNRVGQTTAAPGSTLRARPGAWWAERRMPGRPPGTTTELRHAPVFDVLAPLAPCPRPRPGRHHRPRSTAAVSRAHGAAGPGRGRGEADRDPDGGAGAVAGIWWDPVRRKNIIGLGNSEPIQRESGWAWTTPSPSASCFLIAHTHPRPTPPSDSDFIAVGMRHRRAVAALKGWPRRPGTASFRRFKSLLLPVNAAPMIFTVNRLDR